MQEVLPAATLTHASGAAASLAAELMVAIKKNKKKTLVSLHRLRNTTPLAKSLWTMSIPKIIELSPKNTVQKEHISLPAVKLSVFFGWNHNPDSGRSDWWKVEAVLTSSVCI